MLLVMLVVLLGNANKLGNKNASEYTTNAKFAVLTGNITMSNGSGSVNMSYPAGFTQNNCVPISYGHTYNSGGWRGFGYIQGAIKTGVRLSTNYVAYNAYDEGGTISGTFDFTVVLMRID